MGVCKALNKDGKPCQGRAMANGYCYRHNPDISDADKKDASSRGGSKLAKQQLERQIATAKKVEIKTFSDIISLANDNINDLRAGNIDAKTSNAIVQNINIILKTYEVGVVDARIREIESRVGIEPPTTITDVGGVT